MTVSDNDFLDLQDKYLALKKTVDILLTNLGDPSTMVPGTVKFGPNLVIDPGGIVSERAKRAYTIEATAGNFAAAPPAGNEDMDQNNDGIIDTLDLSYLASKLPPQDSSWVWVNRRSGTRPIAAHRPWTSATTPSYITRGSPLPMSSISGITMDIPNGIMTEATQLDIASATDWGDASVSLHGTQTGATDADASVVIRTEKAGGTIAATLLAYSEDDGVCYVAVQDAPFWLPALGADPANLSDGMVWYRTDTDVIRARINGATVNLATGTLTTVATDTIWDAKGDLAVGTALNTAQVLSVGADGTVLTADSAQTTGIKWAAAAAGSFSYGKAITTSQGQNLP